MISPLKTFCQDLEFKMKTRKLKLEPVDHPWAYEAHLFLLKEWIALEARLDVKSQNGAYWELHPKSTKIRKIVKNV